MCKKADKIDEKLNPIRKNSVTAEYREILIGDKELEDKYGDINISVAVYGGINLSQNVISFLKLPARMRMFGSIDRITGQKKTEEFGK